MAEKRNDKALNSADLDKEYENNRRVLMEELCELLNVYLEIGARGMDKVKVANASASFAFLRNVLNEPSKFFSEKVTNDWMNRVKDYANENKIDFDKAIEKVTDPAGDIFCQVAPCLFNTNLAVFVHALLSYTWFYEWYKADSLPNAKELKPRIVAEIKYLREQVHTVLNETLEFIVCQGTLQMSLRQQQNIKQ